MAYKKPLTFSSSLILLYASAAVVRVVESCTSPDLLQLWRTLVERVLGAYVAPVLLELIDLTFLVS